MDLERRQATVDGKTGKRAVLLSTEAIGVLARCVRGRDKVFDGTNARKLFDAACKTCELHDFHWHDLRHTHATWLRQCGAPLEVVARSLGHLTIQVTQRYAHVDDQEVKAALSSLPDLRPLTGGNVVKLRKG